MVHKHAAKNSLSTLITVPHNTAHHAMIKHCVFVRFKPSFMAEKRGASSRAFEPSLWHINGTVSLGASVSKPFESKSHVFDHGFVAQPTGARALGAYPLYG